VIQAAKEKRHRKERGNQTSLIYALTLYDLTGLDAAGADAHALARAVDLGFDWTQVYVPAAAGLVVRVRHVVSELRAFAAEFTFGCHGTPNLIRFFSRNKRETPGFKLILCGLNVRRTAEAVGTSGFEPLSSTLSNIPSFVSDTLCQCKMSLKAGFDSNAR
jgi:hypothetical protein